MNFFQRLKWFYATRMIGAVMIGYGLFFETGPDRGTIILTGAGRLGIDKVSRNEPKE